MPAPLPYSPAVRAGDWLVVSGQIGQRDGALVEGGFGPQLDQVLANLGAVLDANGAARTDVVKCTVFLTDMADFDQLNPVYAAFFGDHRPARSAIAVAALPRGAAVEIEAWCHLPARG
jgi:2-iminobutanoate/2-iminopropanoate deaminase